MVDIAQQDSTGRRSWRDYWSLAAFSYRTFIAPWPPFTIFVAVTAVLAVVTPTVIVFATSSLIDAVVERAGIVPGGLDQSWIELVRPVLPWLGLLLFMRLVTGLLELDPFHRFFGQQLALRSMKKLEDDLFGKAIALRLEWFEHPRNYDGLQRAIEAMDEQSHSWAMLQIQNIVTTVFSAIGVLIALLGVHWGVPFLMVAATGILLFSHTIQMIRYVEVDYSQTAARRRKDYWGKLLTERPPAAEVRLFGLAGHIIDSWRRITDRMLKEKVALRRRNLALQIPSGLAGVALFSIVLASLVWAANAGSITAGAIVAYLYITQGYIGRVNDLSWRSRQFQEFMAKVRYMPDFLGLEQEDRKGGVSAPARIGRSVRFEDISFTYPGGKSPVLSSIDLEIRPGETIALVGENGAGKTTLTKLLLGLYEPTGGRITVDGTDLAEIDVASWREQVGAVFQDYMDYAFTARENVGFGRIDRVDDTKAIRSAAVRSGADEVIGGLPLGYETLLGREFEGGQDLSRGQWQTLAIARLYLRDAQLLVLDEPTSALDALAELEVYREFLELSADKTVLLISHRLGSARLADRVVFLQEGRIVEEGTHDQLVETGGAYAELFEMQAEWYR